MPTSRIAVLSTCREYKLIESNFDQGKENSIQ